ncbi:MAG: signal peptidase I [Clostridia bacterium]|nr:signal peptidase I [Clostridia bacterium]
MNKKQNIYNYIIILFLIIYNFIYQSVILKLFKNEESIITSVFLIVLFIACVIMYGFAKSKLNPTKKKATKRVGIIVVLAIAVTYGVGAFVGFLRNGYSLALINILKNTYAPIFIAVFTELFRYNFIRANKNKFKMVVILTILLAILEMQMNMAMVTHWGLQKIFIVATTIVIPAIAQNMILSYLSYEVGYQPCLIYRLILELYIYFVPYLPKFGDYLNSMFGLILPMIVFMYASEDVEYEQNIVIPEFIEKKSKFVKLPMYIVIFTLIALISRIFPIFMIGIGSESMTGALNKGDAVIACKVKEENIQVDDIIVFQAGDKVLIHRVVEIENINGVNHYRTKGDINGTRDNVDITSDKIYGEVYLRIPYIAYPSVYLSEFMQKHS